MQTSNTVQQYNSTDGNLKVTVLVQTFSILYRIQGSLPFLKEHTIVLYPQ